MEESTILRPGQRKKDKFSSLKQLKGIDIDHMSKCRVLVVGAGSLGNEVCKNLVLSSFQDITIADFGYVFPADLNHCVLFSEEDAKKRIPKAKALAKKLQCMNSGIRVETFIDQIENFPDERYKDFDVIIGCMDNLSAKLHINIRAFMANVPFIDGAAAGYTGRVMVVNPPDSCLQCYMNHTHSQVFNMRFPCYQDCKVCGKPRESRKLLSCPECGTPYDCITLFRPRTGATITLKSIIAGVQVREALKIANDQREKLIHHMFYYNTDNNYVEILEIETNPDCAVHLTFGYGIPEEGLEAATGPDIETEAGAETEPEGEPETETEAETESESESESESETEAEAEVEAETKAEAEAEAEADTKTKTKPEPSGERKKGEVSFIGRGGVRLG